MDTINLRITKRQVSNMEFLEEIPCYLTSISSEGLSYGKPTIYGKLKNFDVSINKERIKIGGASLTKYFFDNNLSMMSRVNIKEAFQMMSDTIHLPVEKSDMINFHFGKNIIVNHEVNLYKQYLGNSGRSSRNELPHGILYKLPNNEFSIYDKLRETSHLREPIPPIYKDRFMMRLESRYLKNLCRQFNKPIITASLLYDEHFFGIINENWFKDYSGINKIKENKIDMSEITTVEQMKKLGVLSLIVAEGGILNALHNLKERYAKGELTKKQHHDLKGLIKRSSNMKLQTVESELIIELNQKVLDAFENYN